MLGFDRRYVLVPIVVLVALLIGAFLTDNEAQRRLAISTQRIQAQQLRHARLTELMQLLLDAENGQRGYLLTGEDSFLRPYLGAQSRSTAALDELRQTYEQEAPQFDDQVENIRNLVVEELQQLENALKLQQTTSRDAAVEFIRTGIGKNTMIRARTALTALQREEDSAEPALIEARIRDLRLTRDITGLGLALNILLVLLTGLLISDQIRRRVRDAESLLEEKTELERLVAARTADLSALSSHLQQVTEQEKSELARELHDELGGLLVAAKMDISWLRRREGVEDPDSRTRWLRILSCLDAGVNLKRRVVEQLRPTLLDNMGLFAALRWQLQESCVRAGLTCSENLPDAELPINGAAAIAIFRVVQEALTNVIKHAAAKAVDMDVAVVGEHMTLTVRDDGVGMASERILALGSHGLLGMRHRVQSLGGLWSVTSGLNGRGTQILVRLPLSRILAETPPP